MRRHHLLAALPPFLVGLASVVATEISLGLLLYSGAGFLRALTLVLAILLGALALGFWSAPGDAPDRIVDAVRRRWLLVLLAYAGAAVTAGAWSWLGGLASRSATRGLGLAFLAALPLYGSGTVLGAIGVSRPGRAVGVAVAAAAGAAAGAVLTGVILVPSVYPVSMYGLCLVLLSGGALVHGRVLDRHSEERLVDEESSLFGVVRVADRQWGTPRRRQRRLTVGGRLVGGTEDGVALRPWEKAAGAWLEGAGHPAVGEAGSPGSPGGGALLLGGSAVVLQARLGDAGIPLVVVERNPVLWRMTVRHFGLSRSADGLRIETDDPMDAPLEGRYGTVVVDGAGVAPGDAVPLPSASLLRRIRGVLLPDGRLVLGGDDPDALRGEEAGRAMRQRLAGAGFTRVVAFAAAEGSGPGRALLVAGGPGASLPGELEGMTRLELPEVPPAEGEP